MWIFFNLNRCFSNFRSHWHHLPSLKTHRILAPPPEFLIQSIWNRTQDAFLTRPQEGLCGVDAAILGTTLWEPLDASIADFLDHIVKSFPKWNSL